MIESQALCALLWSALQNTVQRRRLMTKMLGAANRKLMEKRDARLCQLQALATEPEIVLLGGLTPELTRRRPRLFAFD